MSKESKIAWEIYYYNRNEIERKKKTNKKERKGKKGNWNKGTKNNDEGRTNKK